MFGEFTGFDDEACTLGVDGGGFFDEDVFAGLDGGHELGGAEVWGGGEDDVIDVGEGEELFGGVPAGEAVVFADDDGVGEVFEVFAAGGEAVGEEVGEGDDLDIFAGGGGAGLDVFGVVAAGGVDDVGGGAEDIEDGACSAAAAADDADADGVIGGGV